MKAREFEPWRVKLREIRAVKKLSNEKIAESTGILSADTVGNVFNGESRFPRMDTIQLILDALECEWHDVFGKTDAFIGGSSMKELQQRFDIVSKDRDDLVILLKEEEKKNAELQAKIVELENKVKMLELTVKLKEEVILAYKSVNK